MIYGEKDLDYIRVIAKGLLEENDYIQFIAFIQLYEKLENIDKYINNIDLIDELKDDEKIVIMMKITERFINDKIDIEKYYNILDKLSQKNRLLTVFTIRYLKYQNNEKFRKLFDKIIKENGNLYDLLGQMLEFENAL
ncbi:MAG: hypothetical protein ACP5GJ_04570, partial [Nanopusillaceae archaeon]